MSSMASSAGRDDDKGALLLEVEPVDGLDDDGAALDGDLDLATFAVGPPARASRAG